MNSVNDGGPAFPSRDVKLLVDAALPPELLGKVETIEFPNHRGMSLRDYFAGQALLTVAHAVVNATTIHNEGGQVEVSVNSEKLARAAYGIADAMLAARAAPTAASGA